MTNSCAATAAPTKPTHDRESEDAGADAEGTSGPDLSTSGLTAGTSGPHLSTSGPTASTSGPVLSPFGGPLTPDTPDSADSGLSLDSAGNCKSNQRQIIILSIEYLFLHRES